MPRMKIEYKADETGVLKAHVTVWESEEESPAVEAIMEPEQVSQTEAQAEELLALAEGQQDPD